MRTFVITLTATAPATAQCLTNEATVTGDEEDPNLANNKSSVQTCTEVPKLGVTKKDNLNPLKFETVGQVVTYTIVATNESANVTLHNVTVERHAGARRVQMYAVDPGQRTRSR